MKPRRRIIARASALFLCAAILLPALADARGSRRRNYADEMRRDRIRQDREDERREREDRYYKEREEREERYYEHRERQSDKYIAHSDRVWGTTPGSSGPGPAPAGGPCMYGGNDEVIYRPAGAVCKGDKPAPRTTAGQPAAKQTPTAPAKETKGTCVYGKSGKLMWSSPGTEC